MKGVEIVVISVICCFLSLHVKAKDSSGSAKLSNILIAVKTSKQFQNYTLPPIIHTWFQKAKLQTWFFTDFNNPIYQSMTNDHVVVTKCPIDNERSPCCQMSAAIKLFGRTRNKWLCYFEDETYVNIPELVNELQNYDYQEDWYIGQRYSKRKTQYKGYGRAFWYASSGAGWCLSRSLAKKVNSFMSRFGFVTTCIRFGQAGDTTLGFIVGGLLGVNLTVVPTFHSNDEPMDHIPQERLKEQITLGYGTFTKTNIVNVPGLPHIEDPTRFISLHCYLYPCSKLCKKHVLHQNCKCHDHNKHVQKSKENNNVEVRHRFDSPENSYDYEKSKRAQDNLSSDQEWLRSNSPVPLYHDEVRKQIDRRYFGPVKEWQRPNTQDILYYKNKPKYKLQENFGSDKELQRPDSPNSVYRLKGPKQRYHSSTVSYNDNRLMQDKSENVGLANEWKRSDLPNSYYDDEWARQKEKQYFNSAKLYSRDPLSHNERIKQTEPVNYDPTVYFNEKHNQKVQKDFGSDKAWQGPYSLATAYRTDRQRQKIQDNSDLAKDWPRYDLPDSEQSNFGSEPKNVDSEPEIFGSANEISKSYHIKGQRQKVQNEEDDFESEKECQRHSPDTVSHNYGQRKNLQEEFRSGREWRRSDSPDPDLKNLDPESKNIDQTNEMQRSYRDDGQKQKVQDDCGSNEEKQRSDSVEPDTENFGSHPEHLGTDEIQKSYRTHEKRQKMQKEQEYIRSDKEWQRLSPVALYHNDGKRRNLQDDFRSGMQRQRIEDHTGGQRQIKQDDFESGKDFQRFDSLVRPFYNELPKQLEQENRHLTKECRHSKISPTSYSYNERPKHMIPNDYGSFKNMFAHSVKETLRSHPTVTPHYQYMISKQRPQNNRDLTRVQFQTGFTEDLNGRNEREEYSTEDLTKKWEWPDSTEDDTTTTQDLELTNEKENTRHIKPENSPELKVFLDQNVVSTPKIKRKLLVGRTKEWWWSVSTLKPYPEDDYDEEEEKEKYTKKKKLKSRKSKKVTRNSDSYSDKPEENENEKRSHLKTDKNSVSKKWQWLDSIEIPGTDNEKKTVRVKNIIKISKRSTTAIAQVYLLPFYA